MPHEVSLITTIAAAFGLAMVMGFIASKLRMPALTPTCSSPASWLKSA
jgi:CPA2 family monovalent cation:H+ antiporter-2